MVITLDNKEYLYSLRNLSSVSHIAKLFKDEIERVLFAIGPKKFSAVNLWRASHEAALSHRVARLFQALAAPLTR